MTTILRTRPRGPLRRAGGGLAILALLLAGCAGGLELPTAASLGAPVGVQPVTTGSIEPTAKARGGEPVADPAAVIQMARSLRTGGDREQSYQVLERAALRLPADPAISAELGLAALDLGRLDVAEKRLRRAITNGAGGWQLHMGLATALAAKGLHDEAKAEFAKALSLSPGHPSILNNMAMARSMAGDRAEAEQLLLKASANPAAGPQVKQNLALVLALNGKLVEAERVVETGVPKSSAPATLAYLRSVSKAAALQRPAKGEPQPARPKAAAAAPGWAASVIAASDKR